VESKKSENVEIKPESAELALAQLNIASVLESEKAI